ncbi:related to tetracycline resistance proteins [Fusarium fujikuroi IMI 58289]|uniref:Related to tetracycline resistance proteins n=1 Tax=Gibberella fujikuroi (strain CBS 195.34 / IMI 58289 / NRRL A-6831) TaxID=1279085 RepID=S0DNG0_GIBF5|nr:related to tetracycline resistance proteins [Fusarium fujikuroi IMI 58289]KLO95838.1 tetracycline resistance protein [Fusarium fujikuroi]KLP20052.1 tetracycline resistance protein [Fusarium fujikuroi]CCT63975.1 related to tetracycline resistance proteins [Fusarium fujikuroi IMI 58289]
METSMLSGLSVVQPVSTKPAKQDMSRPLTAAPMTTSTTNIGSAQRESFDLEILPVRDDPKPDNASSDHIDDLEMSQPDRPDSNTETVEVAPTIWDPFMNRFRLLSTCLSQINNALSDGATGALIPYMEKYYGIGYATVSLIFVGKAIGFIAAAVFIDILRAKLGRAKLLGLGQALVTLAYIPIISGAPFIVVVLSFFFIGFSISINVAIGNLFCGGLQNGTFMLGVQHGTYGIGATIGPLVATALVTAANTMWNRYYIITCVLGALTVALGIWSFWRYEQELSPTARQRETAQVGDSLSNSIFLAMNLRIVFLGSLFIFAYQGAEVSISGWVISFLINDRDGDPSSVGYATAGFWAGITIGAVAFQLLVWLIPNIVGNTIAVSVVGLLLGPIYPCASAVFLRGMTRREALTGIGMINACDSAGGAIAPFVTGLLAQAFGTFVLHPIVIFLFAVMLMCWYFIPAEEKRTE